MIDQLLYVSDATGAMDEAEWERIQRSTAIYNAVNGITGLCCYDGNGFMQLLEGRRERVRALMVRIEQDNAHENLEILHNCEVDFASYGQWSMRFDRVSDDPVARRADFKRLLVPTLLPELRQLIADWFERAPRR